jgi:ketosteroid isomerase-like protein
MKKIFIAAFLIASCNTQPNNMSKQAAGEIIKADKEMSDLAMKEGFHKALLLYADDSVVKPQENELPVIGKTNLEKYWQDKADTKDITWIPFKAEAAASGDIGYSLGNWKYAAKDTTMYGFYYTIWKKQKDGAWKFTVDGGNNSPKP